MSSLMRWDPVREMTTLRDAMDQLVEQAVLRPGLNLRSLGGSTLGQMNVFEASSRYICQVFLPGVTAKDIDLTVRQNTLTIKATQPELVPEESRKELTYLLREFGPGEFTRSISFPKDVDGDAVQATLEQGVLTIAIPLAQHAQPHRIEIAETPKQSRLGSEQTSTVVDEHQPAVENHTVATHA